MENFKKKLVRGFAWQASTKLFVQVFSWVSTIWVARLLTPDDYGLVAMSGLVVGIFIMLATTGFAAGIVNRVNINKAELDTVFWLSMGLGIGLYAIIFCIADSVADFYEEDELSNVIKVAGLMVLICAAKLVPSALALRALDYKIISLNDMLGAFVGIFVTLSMAMIGYKYWSLIIGTIAAEAVKTLVYYVTYRFVPSFVFKIRLVFDLLHFGVTLLVASALNYISGSIPIFLLSTFTSTTTTGYYQMAYTFGSLPSKKVGSLFSNLIFPAMSRIKNDNAMAKTTFIQMHTTLLFVTGPMFIGLALIAEPLILVILTTKWLPIVLPFQAICVIAIFQMSSLFITRSMEGLGDAKVSFKYQLYSIIVCGSCMLVGVYNWDLEGMLLGWLVSSPILYIYLLVKIANKLDIRLNEVLKMYLPLITCLLFMCLVTFLLLQFVVSELSPILQLITTSLCGSLVFLGASFLFARPYVENVKRVTFNAFKRG